MGRGIPTVALFGFIAVALILVIPMKKKRLVGVTVLGIISIICGMFILTMDYHLIGKLVFGLDYLIFGFGVLLLKPWARRLILLLSTVHILAYFLLLLYLNFIHDGEGIAWLVFLSPIILSLPISSIVFFTRSKVKEQFK